MKTASLAHTEPSALHAKIPGTALRACLYSRKHLRNRKAILPGISPGKIPAWFIVILAAFLAAFFTACSSEPSKPAEPAKSEVKGPELITGRSGFQKTFVAARGWQPDARPYRIEAIVTSDGNGHDGKWAMWRGSFASPNAHSVKSYTWSGSAANGAPERGVNPGVEDSYNPSNSNTQIFDIAFLKVDSDQAFETAQKHGGDKILEKAPDTPVSYVCDWNHNTNQLVWHVIYGASRDQAKLTVAVNATTGEFIRVEK
jgi:hypothetical protein